jgi:hypothetical protein
MDRVDTKFGPEPGRARACVSASVAAAQLVALTILGYLSRASALCAPQTQTPSLALSFLAALCVTAVTVAIAVRSNESVTFALA